MGRDVDGAEDEGIVLAGVARSAARRTAKNILDPLLDRGARIDPEGKVIDDPISKDVDAPIPEDTPAQNTAGNPPFRGIHR